MLVDHSSSFKAKVRRWKGEGGWWPHPRQCVLWAIPGKHLHTPSTLLLHNGGFRHVYAVLNSIFFHPLLVLCPQHLSYASGDLMVDASFMQTLWNMNPISSGCELAEGTNLIYTFWSTATNAVHLWKPFKHTILIHICTHWYMQMIYTFCCFISKYQLLAYWVLSELPLNMHAHYSVNSSSQGFWLGVMFSGCSTATWTNVWPSLHQKKERKSAGTRKQSGSEHPIILFFWYHLTVCVSALTQDGSLWRWCCVQPGSIPVEVGTPQNQVIAPSRHLLNEYGICARYACWQIVFFEL